MAKPKLFLVLFFVGLVALAGVAVKAALSHEVLSTTIKYLIEDLSTDHGTKNLMLGSSSIRRLGEEAIPACGPWLNRGIGSSTISTLDNYLDLSNLTIKPPRVLVYAGENDISSGDTSTVVMDNYRALLEKLLARFPSSDVHVIAIKSSPARQLNLHNFITVNLQLQDYAGTMERVHFHSGLGGGLVAVQSGSLGDSQSASQGMDPSNFQADGIHLTEQGYLLFLSGINQACAKK